MQQKRRRTQVKAYNEINLTNLIDTLFFLLIIFMITAPLLEYSIDVTPPEMNADPIKPDSDSKIINVKADGSIVYDRRTVTEAELQVVLSRIEQQNGREGHGLVKNHPVHRHLISSDIAAPGGIACP